MDYNMKLHWFFRSALLGVGGIILGIILQSDTLVKLSEIFTMVDLVAVAVWVSWQSGSLARNV